MKGSVFGETGEMQRECECWGRKKKYIIKMMHTDPLPVDYSPSLLRQHPISSHNLLYDLWMQHSTVFFKIDC